MFSTFKPTRLKAAVKRFAGKVLLPLAAAAALTAALGLENSASAQQFGQGGSFNFGFSTSRGQSSGWGPGGVYNNNYANSNWNLGASGYRYGNTPFGGFNQGYQMNLGGGAQQQWGGGFGPSGGYNYNNRNDYFGGGFRGWNNGW